ncbi:MAG TPA: transglycosylase domain-containing protein, partial [Eudoraea sp.]|nr:transglycosylase domain-containing protein [Eudoraea sp.]
MIFKKIKSPFLRYALIGITGLAASLHLFILSIYFGAWGRLPDKESLSDFNFQEASEIYSADSVLIGKYYLYDRQPISFEAMPQHLINALIAIEDERFYEHTGIDYKSLFRVAIKTVLMQDQSAGGGSTISQQLAKNLYPRQKTGNLHLVVSKVKEMIIARRLEYIYSKETILLHYLNTVSFGDNTFGIESASLKFFNKRAKELSIEESATLIGMLKATYGYNPRVFPEASLNRRNLVLQSMWKNDFLQESLKDSLMALPLKLDYKEFDHNAGIAPYFREEVRKLLTKWTSAQNEIGSSYNIYTSGLKIYTTLNYKLQLMAEEAMVEHMTSLQNQFEKSYGKNAPWLTDSRLVEKVVRNSQAYKRLAQNGWDNQRVWDSLEQKKTITLASWDGEKTINASTVDSIKHYMKFLNTGSLSIDPRTGAVMTWIGGIDYKRFKFDHVSQSRRQVGSTFKPILYTAALEVGIPPCTYFSAREVEYENLKGWSPANSGDKNEDFLNYSMEEALSN